MILIGMFDSPFVRRVAISMDLLGLAFEHRNWSVGRDFDQIRAFSPLGRVPVLVLDDGEVLTESTMILDYLDGVAGPAHALLPAHGTARRQAQRLMGFAIGAAEKALHQVIERAFRPEEKRHAPWVERCNTQMRGAFEVLEQACVEAGERAWLVGDTLGQADITLACCVAFARDAVPHDFAQTPALAARAARYEALPVFARYYVPILLPSTHTKPG